MAHAAVGLDVGTGQIKMAYSAGKDSVKTASMRNVFYEIPQDDTSKEMLKRLKAPIFEINNRIFLAGNDAFDLAKIFGKELRRPMQAGVINASSENQDAVPMIGTMVERLMKEAGEPGADGVCGYSCPADPVDVELDSILHRTLIESKLKQLGWKPKMTWEGHGVILSELEQEDFTGIGFSLGAGMQNVCCSFKGMPVIYFSSCRSGDWIDQKAASRLKIATPRATSIKEDPNFDLRDPKTLEEITIAAYYKDVIRYALEHVKRRLMDGKDLPRFNDPVVVVVSGGTAKVKGVIEIFQEVFGQLQFPVKVKEFRLAKDPIFAAARGALVNAML
jgi:hypothetical protein